jgi:hypothetical protein
MKIDKWYCIKYKASECQRKHTLMKRQPVEQEKILAIYSSEKGLITRTYKEFKKSKDQRK